MYNCFIIVVCIICVFFFQAEDGIRDLVRSRGLGDVYKRQAPYIISLRFHFGITKFIKKYNGNESSFLM